MRFRFYGREYVKGEGSYATDCETGASVWFDSSDRVELL